MVVEEGREGEGGGQAPDKGRGTESRGTVDGRAKRGPRRHCGHPALRASPSLSVDARFLRPKLRPSAASAARPPVVEALSGPTAAAQGPSPRTERYQYAPVPHRD